MFEKRKARLASERAAAVKAAAVESCREVYLANIPSQTDETMLLIMNGRRQQYICRLRYEAAFIRKQPPGGAFYGNGFVRFSPDEIDEIVSMLETAP